MELSPVATNDAGVWIYSDDEEKDARARFERVRWPRVIACPYCAREGTCFAVSVGHLDRSFGVPTSRPGLRECGKCRCEFTVTSWTYLHGSHLPLCCWLRAAQMHCKLDGEVTARDLMFDLKVSYKSAWRIRKVLADSMGDTRNRYRWNRGARAENKVSDECVDGVLSKLLRTKMPKKIASKPTNGKPQN